MLAHPWDRTTVHIHSLRIFMATPRKLALLLLIVLELCSALRLEREEKGRLQAKSNASLSPPVHRQTMYNIDNVQYVTDVNIGNQKLTGVLDTGSFEVLVFAKECADCGRSALYDERKSGSFQKFQKFMEHEFGSGTTTSQLASDTVNLGPLKSEKQYFWQVKRANMPILADGTFNVIIGIGPPNEKETSGYSPLLTSLGTRLFSSCLGKDSGSPGYTIWNDDAMNRMPAKFTSMQVTGKTTWGLQMKDAKFQGGSELGAPKSIGCKPSCGVIIDTGTSLIGVPSSVYNATLKLISGLKDSCDINQLPDLAVTMGGREFRLPPESYVGRTFGRPAKNLQHLFHNATDNEAIMQEMTRSGSRSASRRMGTGRRATSNREVGTNDTWPMSPKDAEKKHTLISGVDTNHQLNFAQNQTVKPVCELLLMDLGDEETQLGPLWILGMPWFREYYTTFNLGDGTPGSKWISAALADDTCNPTQEHSRTSILQTDAVESSSWEETTYHRRFQVPRDVDLSKVSVTPWLHRSSSREL
eukprot:gnl/TRDRNA2_/TRDRNA2_182271_c0_seq1.p1 gnl/TRDRNA2_/TRDRNA2_182271_c0~~gnl/TRDRNA2_/TRDRNA2_182271_c0_seq1.p1  ORF type:complete len:529 (+),score=88.60 gnl/TRDRNA2_/TRDRNA2_182271_c0_seq1:1-1587(+)